VLLPTGFKPVITVTSLFLTPGRGPLSLSDPKINVRNVGPEPGWDTFLIKSVKQGYSGVCTTFINF